MYNQDPFLPTDVTHNVSKLKPDDNNEPFLLVTFNAVVASTTIARQEIYEKAGANITRAQQRDKTNFTKRHSNSPSIKIGEFVLHQNNKHRDKKDGIDLGPRLDLVSYLLTARKP